MFKIKSKNNIRTKSGITLIALVVTIVVLLILAGVSLSLVAGGDGIIAKADNAVNETNIANAKEAVNLFLTEQMMGYYSGEYLGDGESGYNNVQEYILAQIGSTGTSYSGYEITGDASGNITVKQNNKEIVTGKIDENGGIEFGGSGATGTPIENGKRYTIAYNSNDGYGTMTSTKAQVGTAVNLTANTFKKNGYKFQGWSLAKGGAKQYENSASVTDLSTQNGATVTLYAVWEEQTQTEKSQKPEEHIPTGFHYTTGTVAEGYVIADDGGNEFVWIPIANDEAYAKKLGKNNYYLKSGTTGWDNQPATSFSTISDAIKGDVIGGTGTILGTTVSATLADAPEYAVVKKAGGFWVGRYEAGIASAAHDNIAGITDSTSDTTLIGKSNEYWETNKSKITVKSNMEPVRDITQQKALAIANSWKTGTENTSKGTVAFQSGLITGSQWDAVCKFIGWDDIADKDCASWGNYGNVAGASYTGYHSGDCKANWFSDTITKKDDYTQRYVYPTGMFIKSGLTQPNTVQKNIYDIAGNVWEWTTEIPQYSVNNAVHRGGGAFSSYSNSLATFRDGHLSASDNADWAFGFRLVLYVQ